MNLATRGVGFVFSLALALGVPALLLFNAPMLKGQCYIPHKDQCPNDGVIGCASYNPGSCNSSWGYKINSGRFNIDTSSSTHDYDVGPQIDCLVALWCVQTSNGCTFNVNRVNGESTQHCEYESIACGGGA